MSETRDRPGLSLLAAVAGVLTVTLLLIAAFSGFALAPTTVDGILPLWALAWIGFPVVGSLIAVRRPGTAIGWLLIGAGAAIGAGQLGSSLAKGAFAWEVVPDSVGYVGLLAYQLDLSAFMLLGLALLRFPGDRWSSRRWTWFARGLAACAVLWPVSFFARPVIDLGFGQLAETVEVVNPFASSAFVGVGAAFEAVGLAGMLLTAVAAVHLVWRGTRSSGLERQQMKWLALAAATFLTVIPALVAIELAGVLPPVAHELLVITWFIFGFGGMAAAMGVAVLRFRLYDVDRVASRTATYAVLTALLVGVYAVGVVLVGGALRPFLGDAGGDLVVAASTLAVAALFAPMRRRIQRVMDRRFNRAQVDAARTVEEFSQQLRDEVDLQQVADRLRQVAATSLEPAAVGIWLRHG